MWTKEQRRRWILTGSGQSSGGRLRCAHGRARLRAIVGLWWISRLRRVRMIEAANEQRRCVVALHGLLRGLRLLRGRRHGRRFVRVRSAVEVVGDEPANVRVRMRGDVFGARDGVVAIFGRHGGRCLSFVVRLKDSGRRTAYSGAGRQGRRNGIRVIEGRLLLLQRVSDVDNRRRVVGLGRQGGS